MAESVLNASITGPQEKLRISKPSCLFYEGLHLKGREELRKPVQKQHVQSPQTQSLILAKLPAEIWNLITLHLPLASKAFISLSCKFMLSFLGKEYLSEARRIPQERLVLLRALSEPFHPHEALCYACYHFYQESEPSSKANTRAFGSDCGCRLSKEEAKVYLFEDGSPSDPLIKKDIWRFQLSKGILDSIMIGNQYPLSHGITLDHLNSDASWTSNAGRSKWDVHVRSLVVQKKLMMRVELLMPVANTLELDCFDLIRAAIPRCGHNQILDPIQGGLVELFCDIQHGIKNISTRWPWKSDTIYCDRCSSEYCIELWHSTDFEAAGFRNLRYKDQELWYLAIHRYIDFGMNSDATEWNSLISNHPSMWRKVVRREASKSIHYQFEKALGKKTEQKPVYSVHDSNRPFWLWNWRQMNGDDRIRGVSDERLVTWLGTID